MRLNALITSYLVSRTFRALVLTMAMAVVSACGSLNSSLGPEVSVGVMDTKLAFHPMAWLDDETLVVIGESGETTTRQDGSTQRILRVMTLNYRTGAQETFGKFTSQFCFNNGYVSYFYLDPSNDELWISYGPLGKELVTKTKPGEIAIDWGAFGSCRPWNELPPLPDWTRTTETLRLWPRVGIISCNVRSYSFRTRNIRASFHKLPESTVVELPFSCFDVKRGFRYYAFNNAYFSPEQDLVSPWPKGRDRRLFWLYADGTVETVTLTYSPYIRDTLVPTARGIVALTQPASGDENLGVYLISPAGPIRILRGYAAGVLSPNGCRMAVLHDPDFLARLERRSAKTPSLKILELCPRQ
jgi:hypothetical protein